MNATEEHRQLRAMISARSSDMPTVLDVGDKVKRTRLARGCDLAGEHGWIKGFVWVERKGDTGRTLRALVLFNEFGYGYEQFNDVDDLVLVEKKQEQEGQNIMKTTVTFTDLSNDEALKIFAAAKLITTPAGDAPKTNGVANGKAHAAPPAEPEAAADEEDEEPAPRKGPPPPRVDASKVTVAKAPAPAPKKAAAKAPEPEEEEEDEEPAPPKKASAKAKESVVEDADEEEEAEAPTVKIPKKVLEAKKLREVLDWLMDERDITDIDDLKAECMKLKGKIPVLQRISNIEERVERTLDVIDAGEAAS